MNNLTTIPLSPCYSAGVMFHHFHDKNNKAQEGSVSQEDLWRVIDIIGRNNILNADEYLYYSLRDNIKQGFVCLTFDDTLLCQYEVAYPILKELNITSFWFINTAPLMGNTIIHEIHRRFRNVYFDSLIDFYKEFNKEIYNSRYAEKIHYKLMGFVPEKYLVDFPFYTIEDRIFRYIRNEILTEKEFDEIMTIMMQKHNINKDDLIKNLWLTPFHIKSLYNDGNIIGLHSHTHPMRIDKLSYSEQYFEYSQNYEIIKNITGEYPNTVAHPCNSYSPITLEILSKKLGIVLGFRSNARFPCLTNLESPRIDIANLLTKQYKD